MITHLTQPTGFLKNAMTTLLCLLICALILEPMALHAQSRRKNNNRNQDESTERRRGTNQPFSQQTLEDRAAQLEEMGVGTVKITSIGKGAYESIIQSGRYIVGPGDMFAVVIGTGETLEASEILVGASGDLVIPNIGAIPVATHSLKNVQERIQKTVSKEFQALAITISLSRLRTFPINVHGEVQFPGAYGVNGVEQASELIIRAGGLLEETGKRASMRNIQIKTLQDDQWVETDRHADLLLWNLTGQAAYNPYLLDGDQIFVPPLQDSISVSGAVHRPGNYEYAPTDRVTDLITLGGGLQNPNQIHQAQILRRNANGEWLPIQIDLQKARQGDPLANIAIYPNDKLFILGEQHYVYVDGEVQFPGTYPFETGLTLRRLLKRAQIKPDASLAQASLLRKVNYKEQIEDEEDVVLTRLLAIPRNQRSDEEEALIALKTQQVSGRLPINFSELMANENSPDVMLHDGDVIRIPRFVSSVRVHGAVQAPANIPYDSTATIQHYIDAAGGFTDRARIEGIVLIKGNTETPTKAELSSSVDPGDAIYIPTKDETPGQGYRIFREVLAVAGSIASLILTIVAIQR